MKGFDSARYLDRLKRRSYDHACVLQAFAAARSVVHAIHGQYNMAIEYGARAAGLELMKQRAALVRDGKPIPQELEDKIESMLESFEISQD